jgi:hypothetical protein
MLLPSSPAGRRGASRGEHHVSITGIRHMLKRYVHTADIRDSQGRLAVWAHPHRFRHQRVLDQGSIRMTARYAHLDDETVKREMLCFHDRVNVRGERFALPTDGPLGEAAWMKERIARAKQALPNGYRGLPLVQSCPHPNACPGCENFLADGSLRRIHERQLADTRSLRDRAQQNENGRLVEPPIADLRRSSRCRGATRDRPRSFAITLACTA